MAYITDFSEFNGITGFVVKSRKMTFGDWLKKRKNEDSPIGDLARDWFSDSERPRGRLTHKVMLAHLDDCPAACDGAYRALCAAWHAWAITSGIPPTALIHPCDEHDSNGRMCIRCGAAVGYCDEDE